MSAFNFRSQGHAEDVLLWHRYNYYVLGCGLIPDAQYDAMERHVLAHWSKSVVADSVGSCNAADYPLYIRDGRRPLAHERLDRNRAIVDRWMELL